jgi:hypothetical protein
MNGDDLKKEQAAMRGRSVTTDRPEKKKRPYVPRSRTRRQTAELNDIRRRIQRLISELEGAKDVPSKRLYFEVLNCERDRLLGKPHTALPPPKPTTSSNSKLQSALQDLFSGGERSDAPLKPWGARLKQRQALAARDRASEAQSSPEGAVESDQSLEDQATQ